MTFCRSSNSMFTRLVHLSHNFVHNFVHFTRDPTHQCRSDWRHPGLSCQPCLNRKSDCGKSCLNATKYRMIQVFKIHPNVSNYFCVKPVSCIENFGCIQCLDKIHLWVIQDWLIWIHKIIENHWIAHCGWTLSPCVGLRQKVQEWNLDTG